MFKKKRIYLDYAAATPADRRVAKAMRPFFSDSFANAGAIHEEGRAARRAVEESRERIARTLRVRVEEVLFTASGTESNNLAITGYLAHAARSRAYADIEVLTLGTEHPSVARALAAYAAEGVVVHEIPIDGDGLIDMRACERMLSSRTALVTFAYANSEIGVVQDVKKVVRAVRAYERAHRTTIAVHLDASQAPLYLPCAVDSLGVDLMTLDAGKCGGPKGVGILVKKHAVALLPTMYGGDQEGGIRPGTENVPGIVGAAEAVVNAQAAWAERSARVLALREHFIDALLAIPGAVLNGSRTSRIANNVNISIPGVDGEFAVVTLDVHGVAASTRSACAGGKGGGSHVVRAMTGDQARADSTIRFTLSEQTTRKEVDTATAILREHVARVRAHGKN